MNNMKPVVAIIGRPNVGKSTLFNAVAKKNIAIVDDIPGVTRDRNYTDVTWNGRSFTLVDTGGFDPGIEDEMYGLVQEHARMAVEEADVIILLMDGKQGLCQGDIDIARIVQQHKKPVLYAPNKVENRKTESSITEFYELGVDKTFPVSAKNRLGVSDLLQEVCTHFPEYTENEISGDETVVSIIGRPNVGKSSLINKILGTERLVVSPVAGTTRDPVDSLLRYNKKNIRFIDTAGMRRKSRINYNLEKYCVFQALKSINRSTICVFMIDASAEISAQDVKLAAEIYDRKKACIVVINKWDIIEKNTKTHDMFIQQVREKLSFIDFAPVVIVSALTGLRLRNIFGIIEKIGITFKKRVSTPVLNRGMQEILENKQPPKDRNRRTRIYYLTQVRTEPPVFKLFTNNPGAFPEHYRRYLERSIREKFGFDGVPVCLQFVKKHEPGKGKK